MRDSHPMLPAFFVLALVGAGVFSYLALRSVEREPETPASAPVNSASPPPMSSLLSDREQSLLPEPMRNAVDRFARSTGERLLDEWITQLPDDGNREAKRMLAEDGAAGILAAFEPTWEFPRQQLFVDADGDVVFRIKVWEGFRYREHLAFPWGLVERYDPPHEIPRSAAAALAELRGIIRDPLREEDDGSGVAANIVQELRSADGAVQELPGVLVHVLPPRNEGFFGRFRSIDAYFRGDLTIVTFEEFVAEMPSPPVFPLP